MYLRKTWLKYWLDEKPVAKAIDYALAAKHDKTLAVHVAVTTDDIAELKADWEYHRMPVPLVVVDSPPGSTRASSPSSCSGTRTSRPSAPSSRKARRWLLNPP